MRRDSWGKTLEAKPPRQDSWSKTPEAKPSRWDSWTKTPVAIPPRWDSWSKTPEAKTPRQASQGKTPEPSLVQLCSAVSMSSLQGNHQAIKANMDVHHSIKLTKVMPHFGDSPSILLPNQISVSFGASSFPGSLSSFFGDIGCILSSI